MPVAYAILIMLLAVAASDVLVRVTRLKLPLPFVQILAGLALALTGLGGHLPFSSEVFFLIFLAPLLFADAVRMPQRELVQMKRSIFALAVGLVVVTVVGVGYFVHWLLPSIPLAVGCALGAVLAPTDAVAVGAFTGNLRMPQRLLHLLRGEALLNDASGVVAMRVAVGAALTGQFSAGQAVLFFLGLALGGLALGGVIGYAAGKGANWLSGRDGDDPTGQALLTLLLPFASFLVAEHFHVSGILAAVATGLTFSAVGFTETGDVKRRLRTRSLWHTMEFVLNGIIFVLLGLELPERLGHIPEGMDGSLVQLVGYPVAILGILMLTRLVWSLGMLKLTLFRAGRKGHKKIHPGWRVLAALTLGGVRGTVSLAAVLSIPTALSDGSHFPGRDVLIFLSTAVILVTLLAASAGLPLVLRNLQLPEQDQFAQEEQKARCSALHAARERITEEADKMVEEGWDKELIRSLGSRLLEVYRLREGEIQPENESEKSNANAHLALKQLRMVGLAAQRKQIYHLLSAKEINDATLSKLEAELDFEQASVEKKRAAD